MLTEAQLQEAERILARRKCAREGHDFQVVLRGFTNVPDGILCNRCNEFWRVFRPVDSPTVVVSAIEAPTEIIPRVR